MQSEAAEIPPELLELIARLDGLVPRENAKVQFFQYGGEPSESAIRANTPGYLRLGVEFLKAAVAPLKDGEPPEAPRNPTVVGVDIAYLHHDCDTCFDYLERCELGAEPTHKMTWAALGVAIPCGVIGGFLVLSCVVGAKQIFSWFTG